MAARLYKFIGPNGNAAYSLLSIVESKYFTLIMLAVVMSNTVVMIFETYDDYYKEYHSFFLISERIYLCLYIIECCLKLSVFSWKFFKNLWNCFDLFIIGISLVDLISHELTYDNTQSSLHIENQTPSPSRFERINHFLRVLRVLRVLRSFRALRVLRTIRFIQSLHTIVKTCSKALPAMASISFIMIIITCISAIIARSLFGDLCPEKFSNLVKTIFSLFVLLTLDDWYSIYHVCKERDYANWQLVFCLIYIFIINFILLNLLMAVLVDSFQHTLDYDTNKSSSEDIEENREQKISKNLQQLVEEYCTNNKSPDETLSERSENNNVEEKFSSKKISKERHALNMKKFLSKYFMLMENLEFRIERHEHLTKLAQKSIKLLLTEQETGKGALKK